MISSYLLGWREEGDSYSTGKIVLILDSEKDCISLYSVPSRHPPLM